MFIETSGTTLMTDGFSETETFDIFSGASDEDAVWREAVVGIDQAITRMQQIADSEPDDYFVFSARSGQIIDRINTKAKPESEVA